MAESNAISSFGTRLLMGNGATPEVFVDIAELRDIKGPGVELGTVEVTHHLSTDATREHRPTLKDLTEVSFDIAFVPNGPTHDLSTGLMSLWKNRTKSNYRLTFTSGRIWQMAAYVTKMDFSHELENVHMASVTLKPTGAITEI